MKCSIVTIMTAVIAFVSAAPAKDSANGICGAGQSFCEELSGYGSSYYACDARHGIHYFDCQEGSACCSGPKGISCGMPGTCEEM
ncbi:hypothetical protein E2P81_ATG01826 [Venturia nashicola]|nr:hypothetical protein E2P81_ATG01826 [Venturia nashicola]